MVGARGGVGGGEVGEKAEGGRKLQTSSYKSWDVIYSMVTIINNTLLYLKVATKVDD